MNLFLAVLIGAVLGAIDGAGIFFAAEEPYKPQSLALSRLPVYVPRVPATPFPPLNDNISIAIHARSR